MHSSVWSGTTQLLSSSGRCTCARRLRKATLFSVNRRNAVTLAQGLGALLSRQPQKLGDRPPVTKHQVLPTLEVPKHIPRPHYVARKGQSPVDAGPQVHSSKGLKKMRAACELAARVLQHAGTLIKEGVTTDEIDQAVHKMTVDHGAYPSPLMYGGFPKSVCTSVNEVMCHGIPDARPLRNGDILNVDVSVFLNGYHGDTSAMFYVGEVSEEANRLCRVTKQAMEAGIQQCKPGAQINSIGKAIQSIAKDNRLAVVPDFVGHGVGQWFHSAPYILACRNNEPGIMQVGQTFTVEPILVTGSPRVKMWKDDWTAQCADGSLSAQWEHTVLITPSGHEILTVTGTGASSPSNGKGF